MFDLLYLFIKSIIESHHRRIETKRFLNIFFNTILCICVFYTIQAYEYVYHCFYGVANSNIVLEWVSLTDEDTEVSSFWPTLVIWNADSLMMS